MAKFQNLKDLGLDVTKITDAGLKEVAKLQNLNVLGGKHPNHRRGPQGIGQVASSEPRLNNTQVTKAGVAELEGFAKLRIGGNF